MTSDDDKTEEGCVDGDTGKCLEAGGSYLGPVGWQKKAR